MDESTSLVPNSSDSSESGEGNELCASLESLSIDGTAPAVGDHVSAKVEGTVGSVEGDHVYITVEKVNGQDVLTDSADKAEPVSDEAALLGKAQEADSQSYA